MTRRPRLALVGAICSVLLAIVQGCGSEGSDTTPECAVGTQGCECTPGGACNDGLSCADGFCLTSSGGDDTDVADTGVTDTGEGTDTGEPDAIESDTPEADTRPTDTNTGDLNACGGTGALQLDGETAEPGSECGCGGVVVCEGPDALRCVGDRPENSCGGCVVLPGTDGESCGPCSDGVWECVEGDPDAISCVGATEPNDCGGCGPLDCTDCDVSLAPSALRPAWECSVGESTGSFVCEDDLQVSCQLGGGNACGGFSALVGRPGAPCGPYGLGVQVCDPDDDSAVSCDESSIPENACGGNATLAGTPGDACGECGTWTCDETDPERVVCIEERNACGGCGELDGAPGDACESGVLYCEEPDSLACADTEANACGGSADLNASPGEPCGDCLDGVVQCVSPDLVACVGSTPLNACGGCGLVPGVPGDFCGEGAVWECGDDGVMSCVVNDPRNACGGTATLDAEPGVGCPDETCSLSRWTCTSDDVLLCIGDSNPCGGCQPLVEPGTSDISSPGADCGTCGSGSLLCNPENPNRLLCANDQGDDAFITIFRDADEDTFGDPATVEIRCPPLPDGYVRNGRDCDDSNPATEGSACEVDALCGSWVCDEDGDRGLYCDTSTTPTWYLDDDGDGFGVEGSTIQACTDGDPPDGYAALSGDCNDDDDAIHPDAEELAGDGVDQNCDEVELCYADDDEDGHAGSTQDGPLECDTGPLALESDLVSVDDCNDGNDAIYPDAPELCDGFDNDCDDSFADDGVDETWFEMPCDEEGGIDDCENGRFECVREGGGAIQSCEGDEPTPQLCTSEDTDCRPDTEPDCGGCRYVTTDTGEYVFCTEGDERRPRTEAIAHCNALVPGSTLAVLSSQEELDTLRESFFVSGGGHMVYGRAAGESGGSWVIASSAPVGSYVTQQESAVRPEAACQIADAADGGTECVPVDGSGRVTQAEAEAFLQGPVRPAGGGGCMVIASLISPLTSPWYFQSCTDPQPFICEVP